MAGVLGKNQRSLDALGVRKDARRLGLGEVIPRGHATIAGMGVAPEEGFHAGTVAGGKPRGAGAQVAKLREGIAKGVPAIIEKLTQQAQAGDVASARLLLERTLAPLKATDESVNIDLQISDSLAMQARAVMQAVADGSVAPNQAGAILAAMASASKVIEVDELQTHLEALEARTP